MDEPATIVWFRQDLRLADHPALADAVERGGPIIPVFILADEEERGWASGGASRWWLHQSLSSLSESLRKRKSRLILRRGDSLEELRDLIAQTRARAVLWHRRYEPAAVERDQAIRTALKRDGIDAVSFNGSLLFEPWQVQTGQGGPYKVFAPFWRACQALPSPGTPLAEPRRLRAPRSWPPSLALGQLQLEPAFDWAGGLRDAWSASESAAHERLTRFLDRAVKRYAVDRDRPDLDATSRLSAWLHHGQLSPRQVWHATLRRMRDGKKAANDHAQAFLRQLGWREFAHHLLYHFPRTAEQPLRQAYADFPWEDDAAALEAWQRGRTGYPIVDAGMRQLWQTGWMHNRVRMIVASFLVKHLLIDWRHGAAWFWDTLVDADLANNTLGWQWVAGCGADAAPYFRIFNPVRQGQKFDPKGGYVRRWVPQLAALPDRCLHAPWTAPADVLRDAGVVLGKTYPRPQVEHAAARQRALAALARITAT